MTDAAPPTPRRQRGDRGAVIPIVALVLPVLLVMTAFAVDLGRQRSERRTMQARADVIALDLARLIDGRTVGQIEADPATEAAAVASAARNDIARSKISYRYGEFVDNGLGGVFQPLADGEMAEAVEVRAQDDIDYYFRPGTGHADRTAVATSLEQAGFTIGTKLASVNTQQADLLNGLLGDQLNSNISLDAATYQGLVGSSINLAQLATELGFASPEELAAADVNAQDLFLASADVLDRDGQTAAANVLNLIAQGTDEDLAVDMGDVIEFDAGGGQTPAATAGLDVFNLITGSAYAIDGESAVTIPGIGVTIPGFLESSLSLTVIQGAQTRFGGEGLEIPTQQADLAISQTIGTPIAVGGLLRASGTITLRQSVAGAVGRLNTIGCGANPYIAVGVDPQPVATTVDFDLSIKLLGLEVARVTTGLSASPMGSSSGEEFDYPNEFLPDVGTGTMVEATTEPLGLADLLEIQNTTVTVLGGLGVPLGTLLAGLNASVLDPVLTTLDPLITGPLGNALGLSIGAADLGANDMTCNNVRLIH